MTLDNHFHGDVVITCFWSGRLQVTKTEPSDEANRTIRRMSVSTMLIGACPMLSASRRMDLRQSSKSIGLDSERTPLDGPVACAGDCVGAASSESKANAMTMGATKIVRTIRADRAVGSIIGRNVEAHSEVAAIASAAIPSADNQRIDGQGCAAQPLPAKRLPEVSCVTSR